MNGPDGRSSTAEKDADATPSFDTLPARARHGSPGDVVDDPADRAGWSIGDTAFSDIESRPGSSTARTAIVWRSPGGRTAGQTSYDHYEKALLALLAEWKGGESIDTKIKHLQAGSHLASGVPLNAKTALNAGEVDTLIGGKGLDWFLNLSSKDTLKTYDLKRDRFNVKPKR
jgi:hypothetical protein